MSGAVRIEHVAVGAEHPAGVEAFGPDPGARSTPPPPGAELLLAWRDDRLAARCSLALVHDLQGAPGTSGLVGHYEATGTEAAVPLLREAVARLRARGAVRVLGPMDGSTWHRYRLALRSHPGDPWQDPPFFLGEPRNPFDYPQHFEAAGLSIVGHYETRIDAGVAGAGEPGPLPAGLAGRGVRLRHLDVTRLDDELRALHALSRVAFARNPWYAPIDTAGFLALYRPLAARVDPRFVIVAEDAAGAVCGFLFAYPDLPAADAGGGRLIVKTIATDPALQGLGLMSHLFDRMRAGARAAGMQAVLHALMETSNASERLSARHGGVLYRRYALYGTGA